MSDIGFPGIRRYRESTFGDAAPVPVTPALLSLQPVRLALARGFVAFCFVFPFFNFDSLAPGSALEINFLPVLAAALLAPEITLREPLALLLALPAVSVAAAFGSANAAMRLAVAIVLLHFLFNFQRRCRSRGEDLVPGNLAYRALQAFVALSVVQAVHFSIHPLIPDGLLRALVWLVPRYAVEPYDDAGIRGVQGWASEPSGAGLLCASFAIVAAHQQPRRQQAVFVLQTLLLLLNKSVYCLVLTALIGVACLSKSRRKWYALVIGMVLAAAGIFYALRSARIAELGSNLLLYGADRESNRELARFAQILYPIEQFPHVYKPPTLFGIVVMEPMGLVPLLIGYGSVFGLIWIGYIFWRNFSSRRIIQWPLAVVAGTALCFMAPPDFVPSIIAVAVFSVPALPHSGPLSVSSDNHGGHDPSTSKRWSFRVLGQMRAVTAWLDERKGSGTWLTARRRVRAPHSDA